jgi:hypothetical protein
MGLIEIFAKVISVLYISVFKILLLEFNLELQELLTEK